STSALTNPRVGKIRIAVYADTPPAIAHAIVDICATGTDDSRAASAFAAEARIAIPYRLRRKNTVKPTTRTGVMKSIPTYAFVTSSPPIRNSGNQRGCGNW